MKRRVLVILILASFLLLGVATALLFFRSDLTNFTTLDSLAAYAGLPRLINKEQVVHNNEAVEIISYSPGTAAKQDEFPVSQYRIDEFSYKVVEAFEELYGSVGSTGIKVDADMIYTNNFIETPLYPQDYYYRKYENAVAGAKGINKVPILGPGSRISLIRQMYINVKSWNGYVQPPGFYFGSGLCWSTSTLGYLMDDANKNFRNKYGVPLFVFRGGDRAPHGDWYQTYENSNGGWGYTVLQISAGNPAQDYGFTVNPDLKNIPELADIKIKLVMVGTTSHATGSHGQSLGAYIISNKKF